jgi:hypothetical protein
MKNRYVSLALSFTLGVGAVALLALGLGQARVARATNVYQTLPFSENWGTDNNRIITGTGWTNVPGIEAYGGTDLPLGPNLDPRDVLTPSTAGGPILLADQTHFTATVASQSGAFEFHPHPDGVSEVEVALHANSTYRAPFLIIYVNATGKKDVTVSFDVADIDPLTSNAVQQVALQYRVGESGMFTNAPNGYIDDATDPITMTKKITAINSVLPDATDGASQLQLRIMTTNWNGADEFIAIDNISVTGTPISATPFDEFVHLPIIFR